MLTGSQVKAARSLLNLSIEKFAVLCGVHRHTIVRMESAHRSRVNSKLSVVVKVIKAIENQGITLIPAEQGEGAKFKDPVGTD